MVLPKSGRFRFFSFIPFVICSSSLTFDSCREVHAQQASESSTVVPRPLDFLRASFVQYFSFSSLVVCKTCFLDKARRSVWLCVVFRYSSLFWAQIPRICNRTIHHDCSPSLLRRNTLRSSSNSRWNHCIFSSMTCEH